MPCRERTRRHPVAARLDRHAYETACAAPLAALPAGRWPLAAGGAVPNGFRLRPLLPFCLVAVFLANAAAQTPDADSEVPVYRVEELDRGCLRCRPYADRGS